MHQTIRALKAENLSDLRVLVKDNLGHDIPEPSLQEILDGKNIGLDLFKALKTQEGEKCPVCSSKKPIYREYCKPCYEYMVQLFGKIMGNIHAEVNKVGTLFELRNFGRRVIGSPTSEDNARLQTIDIKAKDIENVLREKMDLFKFIAKYGEEHRIPILRNFAQTARMEVYKVPFEQYEPKLFDDFHTLTERSKKFYETNRVLRKVRNIHNTNVAFKRLNSGSNLDRLLVDCIDNQIPGIQPSLVARLRFNENYDIVWSRVAEKWEKPEMLPPFINQPETEDLVEHFNG